MRLTPSDPDLSSIVARIRDGEIDLQPEFQRGEVWSISKRQRLIDSILRDWHIPPIHIVVENESAKQLVLDGQQRLVAIRDFVLGRFPVDGSIEPIDKRIQGLDGLTYNDLPKDVRRRFDLFAIRVFRITDYEAAEPGELFYRLNQPASLTAAEQRNAFFGDARKQVKALVARMIGLGLDERIWGFPNTRMAYDDIVARVLLIMENQSLREKVTATSLAEKYRSGDSYPQKCVERLESTIELLSAAIPRVRSWPKFNKATAQSWLIFISSAQDEFELIFDNELLANFISDFAALKGSSRYSDAYAAWATHPMLTRSASYAYSLYEDRATSRVLDVSSVVLRDKALWCLFGIFLKYKGIRGINSARIDSAISEFDRQLIAGPAPSSDPLDLIWGSNI